MHDIDKLIDELEGMEKAQPSAQFTQKVMQRWDERGQKLKAIPARTVWAVAAAIALLLMANVWVGVGYKNSQLQSASNGAQSVVNAYGLGNTGFSY